MTIRLLGLKIKITYLFAAIVCLMLFIDRTGLALPVLFAVSAHEFSHLIAMKKLRCAPDEIELIPGSIRIINPQKFDRKRENIILICGPLCNLILFLLFYGIYYLGGGIVFAKWAAVELIIAFFNLLPAKGLDGGSLLFNFLISFLSPIKANFLYICVSVFTGTFFIAFGIISAICATVNPSISILGVYIIILTFSK